MLRLLFHMNYETKHQISINKRESLGLKILKFLLNIQMICVIFMKILKNAI